MNQSLPQRWNRETRLLFRLALAIFTVTVAIGIFNGFHFIQLSRAVLLTHVHAGTLGWITLVAIAGALWLYSGADVDLDRHARGVAVAMAIAVPLYVAAFLTGNYVLRAVFGVPVLLLIVGVVVLLLRGIGSAGVSVPRIGVLLSFITLIIGSTLGVLVQIQYATAGTFLPEAAIGGHASAQVGGYLILFTLSAIEWRLRGADRGSALFFWSGVVQVTMLFLGGLLLAIGILFGIQPLLGSFIPLDVIALLIFVARMAPRVVGARWLEPTSSRHYAIAVPWIILSLVLIIAVVVSAITQGSFEKVDFKFLVAADHAIFIGAMVNMGFALIHDFTPTQRHIWPWTENVVFWVMNAALIGFVTTLLTHAETGEKFFVPFQGLAILVGIVAFSIRLAAPSPELHREEPALAMSA
jgi:hypothetical protein